MTIPEIKKRLWTTMPIKRYEHTLGVEYTACCMAYRFGADPVKARIAGLLHDCAKYVPSDRKISECREAGYEPNEVELSNPSLLHARLGAVYASKYYETDDPEILSAITWHTTGRPEMSLLDKIIYIADYIEPNRDKSPILKEVRELAFLDLDCCLRTIMNGIMGYLNAGEGTIDPMTRRALEYYTQKEDDR